MEIIIIKIWLCLLTAALIGFVMGWSLRGKQFSRPTESTDGGLAFKLRQRDEELAAARAEITLHTSTLDTLRNELATLTKKISTYETSQLDRDATTEKQMSGVAGRTEKHARSQKGKRRSPSIKKDDLKEIVGIGPVLERRLNKLGVYRFKQIARWTKDDIERFAGELQSFGDRITREHWISGAKKLHKEKYGENL